MSAVFPILKKVACVLLMGLATAQVNAQTVLTCNSNVTGQLMGANDVDEYVFEGQPGVWTLARLQAAKGNAFECHIEILDPNGVSLAVAEGDILEQYAQTQPVQMTLPGAYRIRVKSLFGSSDPKYGLSLQFLRPECTVPLPTAADLSVPAPGPAKIHAYWFVARPGEKFLFQMAANFYSLKLNAWIYSKQGQTPARSELTPGLHYFGFENFAQADTVFLLIADNQTFFTDGFSFSLQCLRPDCTVRLACADARKASVPVKAGMDAYSLPVRAGDRLIYRQKSNEAYFFHTDGSPWTEGNLAPGTTAYREVYFQETDTLLLILRAIQFNGPYIYWISNQLLGPGCSPLLTCTEDIQDTLDNDMRIEAWSFEVPPGGDRYRIQGLVGGDFAGHLELRSPNGYVHKTLVGAGQIKQMLFEGRLDTPGLWYVLLWDKSINPGILKYGLSFQRLSPACAETALDCGSDALPGDFSKFVQQDAYRLPKSKGPTLIHVAETSPGSGLWQVNLRLYDKDGQILDSATTTNSAGRAFIKDEKPGEKLLVVSSVWGVELGTYALSVAPIGAANCAVPLECGITVTDSLVANGLKHYRVEAAAGERILVRFGRPSAPLVFPTLQLYRPDGTLTQATFSSVDNLLTWTFDMSGTHELVLHEPQYWTKTIFGLTANLLGDPAACGRPLGYNSNLTENLDGYGDQEAWVFEGKKDDVIVGQASFCGASMIFKLYGPDGVKLDSAAKMDFARISRFRLPVSGKYKLVLGDRLGSLPAAQYWISLQNVNGGGTNATSFSFASPQSATLEQNAASHVWRMPGSAGAKINLTLNWLSNSGQVRAELYAPSGTFVAGVNASAATPGYLNANNLPETGPYTLLVFHLSGCQTGEYVLQGSNATGTDAAGSTPETGPLHVYPNPFSEVLNLVFNWPEGVAPGAVLGAELFDTQGACVAKMSSENTLPALSGLPVQWTPGCCLPDGFYELQVLTERGIFRKKLLKIE